MVSGCLKEQSVNEYFSESFLNNDLLKILPDGYDICYEIKILDDDILSLVFYLYDSEAPMTYIDYKYIVGSIFTYIDQGEDNEINIRSLGVNEKLNGFNLRKAGFGTYLLLIAISYAKSLDIENIKLDDMSDGYRSEDNIYKKIGLEYEDEYRGPEIIGYVDKVYSNLNGFLEKYSSKIINKLDDLTEYFYDDEWVEEEWYDDEEEDEEYEEMDMDGGVGYSITDADYTIEDIERKLILGADPNEIHPNTRGQTLLLEAVYTLNIPLVKLLLDYGADPFQKDDIGIGNTIYDYIKYNLIKKPLNQQGRRKEKLEQIIKMISNKVNKPYLNRPSGRIYPVDISNLVELEKIREENMYDEEPESPDKIEIINESAKNIQKRFRGNIQRRKLTKSRPRYGKMTEPATNREKIRRWVDSSNQFDQDDPVRGYEQFSFFPERLVPDVSKGTWMEFDENERIADYLNTLHEGGSKKKTKKKRKKIHLF